MGLIRKIWSRILLNETDLVPSESPARISERLENATTYVAEFNVATESLDLARGTAVSIDHVMLTGSDPDGYEMKRQFQGIIGNKIGTGLPHQVSVQCIGPLDKLRGIRRDADGDYAMSGKTDDEVVRDVLTYFDITFDEDDITGWGFTLGTVEDLFWKIGQSGAEIIAELDRVFGCATIEIGEGRVVRFPYSRVPADYDLDMYGIHDQQHRFILGQAGSTFYNDEREEGNVPQIANYWKVSGLSYEGAEGTADEGCTFTVSATAIADHPIYGADYATGPEEFSSDLIQTEALAKAIAIRQMEWYNREDDILRIETANNALIAVGDLISIIDETYGIDLPTEVRYLVTEIVREGDFMTIDSVGGAAGDTGTFTSKVDRCCGTQQEDGTCTNVGTDPSPSTPPDPGIPPDPNIGFCDPIEDPTCIPGVDFPLIDPPNTEDPFIDCTLVDGDELNGTTDTGDGTGGPWYTGSEVCMDMPWRVSGGFINAQVEVAGEQITKIGGTGVSISLTYNTTPNDCDALGEEKLTSNDHNFGQSPVLCISGTAFFCNSGEDLLVKLPNYGGSFGPSISFEATPGFTFDGTTYGIIAGSEHNGAIKVGHGPPNISPNIGTRDNGGLGGFPVPLRSEASWSVCFDMASDYQRVIYGGSFGGGYMEDERTIESLEDLGLPGWPVTYDPCEHPEGHKLQIVFDGSSGNDDGCVSWVSFGELGHATCIENPDYYNPGSDFG